jgi:hypothetical protein
VVPRDAHFDTVDCVVDGARDVTIVDPCLDQVGNDP